MPDAGHTADNSAAQARASLAKWDMSGMTDLQVIRSTGTVQTYATSWSDTSRAPDVFDALIRAFTVLALAMREWKETL